MLLACLGDHDPRGAPVKATRRVLRGIATYRSWTVLEVVRALRSGESIKAGRGGGTFGWIRDRIVAWRDLSLTGVDAISDPRMAGWTVRMAYRILGKRNTALGVVTGRPRKANP